MNTTLYLIRHGELDNPQQTIYDSTIQLSKEGEEQMEALGHTLRENGATPDIIITSPYVRAVRSSEMVAESFVGVQIITDDRLHDTLAPEIVGKSLSWLHGIEDIYTSTEVADFNIEKREKIEKRMLEVIHESLSKYKGKTIFIVSHGDPTAFAMWRLLHPEGNLPPLNSLKSIANDNVPNYLEKGEGWKIDFDKSGKVMGREHIVPKESIINGEREK